MEKISILIPVYKESTSLGTLLNSLISDSYPNKEILLVLDEPTKECLKTVNIFKAKVKFIVNRYRKGKPEALNQLVKLSSGKFLLFLDSDVSIPPKKNFLREIVNELSYVDFIDIDKVINKKHFLSRLVHFEYMTWSICSIRTTKKLDSIVSFSGTAFAFKRTVLNELGGFKDVLVEDLDLATRAYLAGKKYKFVKVPYVNVEAPISWSKWVEQRLRWYVGMAFWLFSYFKDLLHFSKNHPSIAVYHNLFLSFPILPSLIISLLFPSSILSPMFVKFLMILIISLVLYSIFFLHKSKEMNFKFNFFDFFVYYSLYVPINLLVLLVCLISTALFIPKKINTWKTFDMWLTGIKLTS